ncbi:MAG: XRE family transcriptional regulator [Rickettsiales bacterium]|jgi:phage repressor protein C with HTH and peptisase S24 domain|nr:XRE family transcriptional regulator [Rickettsiales bacterium]
MNYTINERIKLIRKEFCNDKNKEFAIAVGEKENTVNNWTRNGYKVGRGVASKIADRFNVNIGWILAGEGEMLKSGETTTVKSKEKPVYLYDVSAAAGYGSFDAMISQEKVVGEYTVPIFKGADWMIYVKGSSMYPKYSSGDIIACRVLKESQFIQWGKVYVIATKEQGILVKRLEKSKIKNCIRAVSDNQAYGAFDVPLNEIDGIALVVGVIRME